MKRKISEPSHELLGKIVKMFGIDYNAILDNRDYFERRVADNDMTLNVLTLSERAIIAHIAECLIYLERKFVNI